MNAEFDSIPDFFGTQCQMVGPFARPLVQREKLPGIAGFRVYNLGTDSVTWQVTGIVTALTLNDLEFAINGAVSYQNGGLYAFTTTSGNTYNGCLLAAYAPVGPPQWMDGLIDGVHFAGYFQRINATVEWAQPEL